MAKVCDVCGRGPQFGNRVSHAHNLTKRRWNINLQEVHAIVKGAPKRIRVCTSCIKSGKVEEKRRKGPPELRVAASEIWLRRVFRLALQDPAGFVCATGRLRIRPVLRCDSPRDGTGSGSRCGSCRWRGRRRGRLLVVPECALSPDTSASRRRGWRAVGSIHAAQIRYQGKPAAA